MNLTELEIRKKYRYSILSYVFDVYMECEIRANVTTEDYNGLLPGEFRFDYESWGRRLGFSKKQMERAIKELTVKSGVIIQISRGKKGTGSKYFLTRFNNEIEKNKIEEKNKESNKRIITLENIEVKEVLGEQKEREKENKIEEKNKEKNKESNKRIITLENIEVKEVLGEQKERKEEKKKEHSSQHNNLNILSNKKKGTELDNIINSYTNNIELKKALIEFLKMRKAIKKPMTDRAMTLLLNKLNKLGSNDNEKIEILNQSIFNSWQGIFELKNKKEGDNNANTYRTTIRDRGVFNQGAKDIEIQLPKREYRHYTNEELEELGID